jgi:hypothetical protein
VCPANQQLNSLMEPLSSWSGCALNEQQQTSYHQHSLLQLQPQQTLAELLGTIPQVPPVSSSQHVSKALTQPQESRTNPAGGRASGMPSRDVQHQGASSAYSLSLLSQLLWAANARAEGGRL